MKPKFVVVALLLFVILVPVMIELVVLESLNLVMAICAIIALVVALLIVTRFGDVRNHQK